MSEWTFFARDWTGTRQAQIDEFDRVSLTPRFNDVGEWSVSGIPFGHPATQWLTKGSSVECVRDGTTVLSGPLTRRKRHYDHDSNDVEVSGKDDMVWLARRLAKPVPSGPPYSSQAYDVRTGRPSTIMRQYVDVNAGPTAAAYGRVVYGLTLAADPLLGSSVTARARFHRLLDLLNSIAWPAGLGFRIVGLEFEVYQPVDKSASIEFSVGNGTMAAFDDVLQAPEADWVTVGGGGAGTARTFLDWPDTPTLIDWGRIEIFLDRRDTTDLTEMLSAALEEISQQSIKRGVAITPVEGPQREYLVDYDLGDKITAIVDGERVSDILRELTITIGPDGTQLRPTIGDPDAPKPSAWQQQFARFIRKQRSLETTT